MRNAAFWTWFDGVAAPKLAMREISFRKIFQYLDTLDPPLTLIETGCARIADNWAGDGQSTLLFDRYAAHNHPHTLVHSIDIDAAAVEGCATRVGHQVVMHQGDSVALLPRLAQQLKSENRTVALLYLDSFDLDWRFPVPSAVHHLKELVSIVSLLTSHTLVVVDDCGLLCHGVRDADNALHIFALPAIGGKGTYIAEYAQQVQATLLFSHYQAGWLNLVPS